MLGSTSLVPNWTFDASAQYNPDTHRIARSIVGFRYSPGPYRTVNMNYRLTRGLSEQVEVGWQWPVYGRPRAGEGGGDRSGGGSGCGGTLYSVGRVNYSTRDSRLTDSLARPRIRRRLLDRPRGRRASVHRPQRSDHAAAACSWNSSAFPGSAPIRCGS